MEKELLEIKDLLNTLILSTKEVYTLNDVVKITGFKKSYLYHLTSTNRIPHYKPTNGTIFIEKQDLMDWLRNNKMEVKD